jgi:ATP-binding cassette subfamily B protein RaxB
VLLLRTFFKPNPVVLLDEPTANLDPQSKKSVENIIRLMMEQKTVICITHDPGMIPLFQHVYRLQDGTLKPLEKDLATGTRTTYPRETEFSPSPLPTA